MAVSGSARGVISMPMQVMCVVLSSSLVQSVANNHTPPYVDIIDQLLRAGFVSLSSLWTSSDDVSVHLFIYSGRACSLEAALRTMGPVRAPGHKTPLVRFLISYIHCVSKKNKTLNSCP